jgi:hypothetical protein
MGLRTIRTVGGIKHISKFCKMLINSKNQLVNNFRRLRAAGLSKLFKSYLKEFKRIVVNFQSFSISIGIIPGVETTKLNLKVVSSEMDPAESRLIR